MYTFVDYFCQFWIPTYIETRRRELANSICSLCKLSETHANELIQWLGEDDETTVLTRCISNFKVKKSKIELKIKELALILSNHPLDISLLLSTIAVTDQTPGPQLEKFTRMALKDLGDSHIFINEIDGLKDLGYVVRMRRTFGISTESVFASFSDFQVVGTVGRISGIRITRLTNLYRFKVAQAFAYQFSRIGLSAEITSLNALAVEAAVATFTEAWKCRMP